MLNGLSTFSSKIIHKLTLPDLKPRKYGKKHDNFKFQVVCYRVSDITVALCDTLTFRFPRPE